MSKSESKLRPVRVLKYERRALVFDFAGAFHGWGFGLEEGSNGFSSFSVGIIESNTGQVSTVLPDLIRFADTKD